MRPALDLQEQAVGSGDKRVVAYPPTTPQSRMPDTGRDELERVLLAEFAAVKPLEASDLTTINRFKDGGFATTLLGLMLYSNGHNLRGTSTRHPNGLLY